MNTRKYGYYKPMKPNNSHYPKWQKKPKKGAVDVKSEKER